MESASQLRENANSVHAPLLSCEGAGSRVGPPWGAGVASAVGAPPDAAAAPDGFPEPDGGPDGPRGALEGGDGVFIEDDAPLDASKMVCWPEGLKMPPLGRVARASFASLNDFGVGFGGGCVEVCARSASAAFLVNERVDTALRRPVSAVRVEDEPELDEVEGAGEGTGSTILIGMRRRFGGAPSGGGDTSSGAFV